MKVPLFDPARENTELLAELGTTAQKVLQSGGFILGPEVTALEEELCSFLEASHCVGLSSGTDALLVGLMALGVGPGDEVICPAFTFFATASVVVRLGAVPVICDIAEGCFNLDPAALEEAYSPKTKVVIPVHLFGQAAAMGPINDWAATKNVSVFEDAAQAFGGAQGGRSIGTLGEIAAFSFFPTKNLGGFGDGGAITCASEELADKVRMLRNHGSRERYLHDETGGNFRLDAMQAALLRVKLKKINSLLEARRKNAAIYHELLGSHDQVGMACSGDCRCRAIGGSEEFGQEAMIMLPCECPDTKHSWNQFTIRVRAGRREELREHLLNEGIGCEVYYPSTVDQQPALEGKIRISGELKEARRATDECLSLPIQGGLSEEDLGIVSEAICDFLN